MKDLELFLQDVKAELDSEDLSRSKYFRERVYKVPDREKVISLLLAMQALMFPEYFKPPVNYSSTDLLASIYRALKREISVAYAFLDEGGAVDTESVATALISALPNIKRRLLFDGEAIYEGDPAARSPEEVILSYPGFIAISVYRIAHELYSLGVPYLPRIMTEYAHERTGIDIHAGATIGDYFFIDHGTGIVIGETTTIGDRVKIYQGVTLGAKSFELDENGNPVKGIKRHPDIGDDCVIYANATILGGRTRVGNGAVIGASVWITSSVEAGAVVTYGSNSTTKK